mgnify:CR=1 FL=1
MEETKNGKGSRGKSKVILETIKALAEDGNDIAKKHLEDVQTKHRGFQKKAIFPIANFLKNRNWGFVVSRQFRINRYEVSF